jgi:Flp pilus assembly protein TadG
MLGALIRQARQLVTDRRSIAAVEFAVIAPWFFFIFIGTFEVLLLSRTSEKLNTLAGKVAEMVASASASSSAPITVANLSDICTAAIYGLQPLPANGLTIAIASLTITTPASVSGNSSNTDDVWEEDFTGSGCSPSAGSSSTGLIGETTACTLISNGGGGGTLPTTNGTTGDNAIVVRATLTYPGMVSFWLKTIPTLTQYAYSRWYHGQSGNELIVNGLTPTSITC